MIVNLGSKPKNNCKATKDVVIIIGFLYLMINDFIFINLTTPRTRRATR